MPTLPWQRFCCADPQANYIIQLSYLQLLRYPSLLRFGRFVVAIQKQLSQTAGVIGYSLLARPLQRDFWTLSAWSDKASLNRFVRSNIHVSAMNELREHMGQTRFIEWTLSGKDLPPRWDAPLKRFHEDNYVAKANAILLNRV